MGTCAPSGHLWPAGTWPVVLRETGWVIGHGGQGNAGTSKNCCLLPVGKKNRDRLGENTNSHDMLATCIVVMHLEPWACWTLFCRRRPRPYFGLTSCQFCCSWSGQSPQPRAATSSAQLGDSSDVVPCVGRRYGQQPPEPETLLGFTWWAMLTLPDLVLSMCNHGVNLQEKRQSHPSSANGWLCVTFLVF